MGYRNVTFKQSLGKVQEECVPDRRNRKGDWQKRRVWASQMA